MTPTSLIHWHRPQEQMPDADLSVLVAVEGGLVEQGYWDGECWRWASAERIDVAVTHWAELPEGPK